MVRQEPDRPGAAGSLDGGTMSNPRRTLLQTLSAGILLLLAFPAVGQTPPWEDLGLTNLPPPKRYNAPVVALEIRDLNLALGDLQIGSWPDRGEPLALASLPDVRPPCRSLQVDGLGESVALVCPDDGGVERLLLVVQGVVLRFGKEVLAGSEIGLSDDGVRVAAILLDETGPTLHVIDVQRTRELVVVGLESPRDAHVAGTGSAVACSAIYKGRRDAVVVSLDEAVAHVLSRGIEEAEPGAISANGRRILFRGAVEQAHEHYLVDLDRRQRFNVTNAGRDGQIGAVDLAQHGDTVAFVNRFGGAIGVFTVDLNARKVANRCGFFQPLGELSLSASGSRVAFVKEGAVSDVEVWDLLGKESEQVETIVDDLRSMTMSSDGRFVAGLLEADGREGAVVRLYPLPIRE